MPCYNGQKNKEEIAPATDPAIIRDDNFVVSTFVKITFINVNCIALVNPTILKGKQTPL